MRKFHNRSPLSLNLIHQLNLVLYLFLVPPTSTQSYRYPLLLWLIFLALLLLFTILHHLSFRAGFLSSLWSKLAIKRKVIRTKGQKASDKRSGEFLSRRLTVGRGGGGGGGGAVGGKGKRKRNVVLPSNGQLMAGSVLVLLVAACCVVGADYIDPTTSAWNVGTSFFSKRQSGSGSDSLQIPQYTIGKSWWTSGSRFGLIGFALFPLVVLLALKAPPFAILSLKIFTHLHSDKLALLHRWSGRLIWLVTTIHVVLWTVQLFIDQRGDGEGRSMWFVVWIYDKFQWAVVGYAGMTGLMATSFKPIRQRAYEVSRGELLRDQCRLILARMSSTDSLDRTITVLLPLPRVSRRTHPLR